ncbi:MiaB/RimO family radical SAM methylthiotransferase, partial [Candidatus Omnitrophota bacterium]
IQDGCNNHCAYCKVPIVRGKSKSKRLAAIQSEAQQLIKNGYKEIVLCGICLGSYGKELSPKKTLVEAITAILKINGDFRIRLSSIESRDINKELIELMAQSSQLCCHFHIPFQSGDNEILCRMQRSYTVADYRKTVDAVKAKIPGVAITTDIMIGFPGEQQKHFENTCQFLKYVAPSRIHIFPFSPRKGTAAYSLSDRISMNVIKQRVNVLRLLASELSYEYRAQFLNKQLMVLIEEKKDKKTGFFKGYSDNYIEVSIQSPHFARNRLQKMTIDQVTSADTFATA